MFRSSSRLRVEPFGSPEVLLSTVPATFEEVTYNFVADLVEEGIIIELSIHT